MSDKRHLFDEWGRLSQNRSLVNCIFIHRFLRSRVIGEEWAIRNYDQISSI